MFFFNLFTVLCVIRQRNEIAIKQMNHYRHELLSINNWYRLFNFYTFRDNWGFLCGRISITHRDHIVFIIFEFNDETIIMHVITLYFPYMKPLIKIHSEIYHGKCTIKFEFSWKWQRGFIHVSFTRWIQVFCSNKIQSTDLLHNI